jgi:hypothetical protein
MGHLACMGSRESYTGFWWGNLRGRDHLADPGIDGRIILRCIFRKWDVRASKSVNWSMALKMALAYIVN